MLLHLPETVGGGFKQHPNTCKCTVIKYSIPYFGCQIYT